MENFDIEGKTNEEINALFKDKNVVHIEGGNTFYLLKAIRETGFADILKELLDEGRVYIGTSAGSYVMCPTIEVSNWNPDGKDRFGITDFTALNYVPFVLKVHYTDEMKGLVSEKVKTLKYPIHILKDGQGMFCEDGRCRFIGDEDEIKL
jgi:dipeptidase E